MSHEPGQEGGYGYSTCLCFFFVCNSTCLCWADSDAAVPVDTELLRPHAMEGMIQLTRVRNLSWIHRSFEHDKVHHFSHGRVVRTLPFALMKRL